jgi:Protein kinase domain
VTPERWRRVEAVFEAAADLPDGERRALLDRECGDDADLRAQVESLLESAAGARERILHAVGQEVTLIAAASRPVGDGGAPGAETPSEEAGLELRRWGTRFANADAEAGYREFHIQMAVPFNRTGILACGVIWTLITPAMVTVRPAGFGPWLLGIVLGIIPLCALGTVASYRPSLYVWSESLLMASNAVAGVFSVAVLAFHFENPVMSVSGGCLSSILGFAVFRARPVRALTAVATYMLLQVAIMALAYRAGRMDGDTLALGVICVVAAYSFGAVANVVLDVDARQTYRHQRIIEAQKQTIARERARSEGLLKQELSHQVAARSRDLGQMMARGDAAFAGERLAPGARFDTRYRVERELGSGGMGAVYEVERITDGQRLALKIVTGLVSGAQAVRFAREAEIGARVRHANLVSIVDVGIAGGVPFLAMELARGGSLADQRHRFGDARWARPVLGEIAAGLAALHDAGVVHRDLKPGNVLFSSNGVAQISDFGISRLDDLELGLTATGMLLGTPRYMAPEAARGGSAIGAAGDVFAFGILACELLAGRTPFDKPPVFIAMAGEPMPPPELGAAGDPQLRELLRTCLTEEPANRPSMRSVAEVLAAAQ